MRSRWRLPFIHPFFFSSIFPEKRSIKTALRSLTLPLITDNTGRSFYVYNGVRWNQVIYKKEMAGYKLGSFSLTKVIGHRSKASKKKTQKRR